MDTHPIPPLVPQTRPVEQGQWGFLPNEPCRYCHKINCIFFLVDDGPEGISSGQIVRCNQCKRSWEAGSSSA